MQAMLLDVGPGRQKHLEHFVTAEVRRQRQDRHLPDGLLELTGFRVQGSGLNSGLGFRV